MTILYQTDLANEKLLPKLDEILKGQITTIDPDYINKTPTNIVHRTRLRAIPYSILQRLNYHLEETRKQGLKLVTKEWYEMADNAIEFVENNFGVDAALTFMAAAITDPYNLPFTNIDMPKHKDFFIRHCDKFKSIKDL